MATACSALVTAETWVEDVDAVLVLVDHALQPAHLALDAAQPLVDRFLLVAGRFFTEEGDSPPALVRYWQ